VNVAFVQSLKIFPDYKDASATTSFRHSLTGAGSAEMTVFDWTEGSL
jgi:hypothetical protein